MSKCYNAIIINQPIDEIWQVVSQFHDLSWAPKVITSVTQVSELAGDCVGAKRILNDMFHETLIHYDPEFYTFSYQITDGPTPVAKDQVTDYVGTVKLSDCAQGCLVEWSSDFQSDSDSSVIDFCNPIYQALLKDLSDYFE